MQHFYEKEGTFLIELNYSAIKVEKFISCGQKGVLDWIELFWYKS